MLCFLQTDEIDGLDDHAAANLINTAFRDPMKAYQKINTLPSSNDDLTPPLKLSEVDVLSALTELNSKKAGGPNGIPCWVLKEYAEVLAHPITAISNSSFAEQKCPAQWKMANIVPIPKEKPVKDINKHLQPVSLTPALSRIAEEFIVANYISPAVLKEIDRDQYGAIPKSSTLNALILMIHVHVHHWSQATDGSGAAVNIILVDYRKAFDKIDHNVLIQKVHQLDIPHCIVNSVADFLTNRQQHVKLSEQCFSEWGQVPAGVPQGTKLGPWLFLLMINDLNIPDVLTWKC